MSKKSDIKATGDRLAAAQAAEAARSEAARQAATRKAQQIKATGRGTRELRHEDIHSTR